MKKIILVLLLPLNMFAAELKGVKFEESHKVGDEQLVLNSLGLRTVYVMGFGVKVYVAGLYMKKKSSDYKAIINDSNLRVVLMKFKRSADKEKLINGWNKAFKTNCISNCTEDKKKLKIFNKAMADMRRGGTIEVRYFKDKVQVVTKGRREHEAEIEGETFSKNMMAIFIGENVEDKNLRKGLLGLQ